MTDHTALLESKQVTDLHSETEIVLEGQYKEAYDAMLDAYHAGLYVGLIGPVGSGKTALCRRFAQDLGRPFDWVTFSDLVRPSNLFGSFDPTGFSADLSAMFAGLGTTAGSDALSAALADLSAQFAADLANFAPSLAAMF
jgi:hypothetical protein